MLMRPEETVYNNEKYFDCQQQFLLLKLKPIYHFEYNDWSAKSSHFYVFEGNEWKINYHRETIEFREVDLVIYKIFDRN
jgi:hypothetical protein